MNPIEPGCSAMTINTHKGKYNGKIVTVVLHIGKIPALENSFGDYWVISPDIFGGGITRIPVLGEGQLKRIDPPEAGSWDSCAWKPESESADCPF